MFLMGSTSRRVSTSSETELVNLTLCVGAINVWNRVAISFRAVHPAAQL
jgi:hypothetical protein